ncbi:carbohydrate ABC transporter substrate-binding protein (CUT1 family) [Bacillus sp. V-88]|uniref:sugar ABC transporter substrate-binding protein n=1 Tax=Rossellomorea vietnamensis TaxID=218284 RepID=UPI000550021D|nr:sugar ABC transporter substrate-binding protein [Rossellomorea vietnamensis]OXS58550.1 ABC transporter substrate-binding protein [Bacillus sp. DSM 27956]PRX75448.1 carbohydrate ABC transporter substrate-binding protein (CUT1 family) [Bacillus sp. V-88]SLK23667.1 carbohydrate ABC transporter substrate-binding protein, CUT1 family [Bacillus sp. V-88]
MRKKMWSLLLIGLLAMSTILTACGGNGGSKDGKKEITVWAMGEEGKKLKEMASKFEEENKDISVKIQAIPWGNAHDKLLTAVASGNGPDVLQLGTTWVPEFADAGALLDLTPYLDDYPEFKPENYFEGSVTSMKFDDKVIGVPWYIDTRVLYYRTDLLKEVGYDKAPATWDELKDAAGKLNDRGDDVYGLDIDRNDQITPFIFAWQNGYEFEGKDKMNFDSPEFKEAMEYYTNYFKEGISPTTEGIDIVQAFKDGMKPMFFSGPWMINIINDQAPDLKDKWAVAVMPKKETNTSSMGGSNLSVFHNSENVDESLKFISYMNKVDTQMEWLDVSNTLPSRVDAWEEPKLKEDPMLSVFGQQLEDTKASPQIKEFEVIAQEFLSTIEKVTVGGADVDKELEKFNKKAKEIVEE